MLKSFRFVFRSRRRWGVAVKFVVVVAVVVFWKTFLHLQNMAFDKTSVMSLPQEGVMVTQLHPNQALRMLGRDRQAHPNSPMIPVHNFRDTLNHQQNSFQSTNQSEYDDVKRVVKDLIQSVTSVCRNVTRAKTITYAPTGEYWQMNRISYQDQIFVISAFYDDRPPVGIIPYIRVLTVSTLPKNGTAFCQIWYSGLENPYVTKVTVHSSGRGEKVYGIRYGQWLYSCKLPSSLPVPTHVSIAFDTCQQTSILVPVYVPVRSPWQHEFGICVAIAFGKVDLDLIVEWVEIHKLFGVSEINIYNASMETDMHKVFDYYKNEGILRMHQMPPPQPDYGKKGSKVSSPASLNDCMLRNAYRYRYMVVVDFDEVIVPKKLTNYSAMLEEIDKSNKLSQPWMSYSFRNQFYFYNYAADEAHPKFLRTMRYREHAAPNRFLFAPKSFIDPLQCLSVFNHYCLIRFPGSPKKFTVDVGTEIATSHHYKSCSFGTSKCKEYAGEKSKDDFILGIAPRLKEAVTRVMQNLGLFSKEEIAQESAKADIVEAKKREKRDTVKNESAQKVEPAKKVDPKKSNKIDTSATKDNKTSAIKNETKNVTKVVDKKEQAKNETKISDTKNAAQNSAINKDKASPPKNENKEKIENPKNGTRIDDKAKASEKLDASKNEHQNVEKDKNAGGKVQNRKR